MNLLPGWPSSTVSSTEVIGDHMSDSDGKINMQPAAAPLPWSDLSDVEAEHYELVHRVIRDRRGQAVEELIRVDNFVRELWRALDRGEDVNRRARALYRVVTGRQDDTEARRAVIAAIQRVARRTDAEIGAVLWAGDPGRAPTATDAQIGGLVCLDIRRLGDASTRLEAHPSAVALAVRMWRRGRGRPSRGVTGRAVGSKWSAVAEVLELAGLGRLDEKAVEQLWRTHGFK